MALRVEQLLLKSMEQKTISMFALEAEFFETGDGIDYQTSLRSGLRVPI